MPKKFVGENSKAVAARQRKEDAKVEKTQKQKKATEDAEWEDSDEKLKKKQQKKVRYLVYPLTLEYVTYKTSFAVHSVETTV